MKTFAEKCLWLDAGLTNLQNSALIISMFADNINCLACGGFRSRRSKRRQQIFGLLFLLSAKKEGEILVDSSPASGVQQMRVRLAKRIR